MNQQKVFTPLLWSERSTRLTFPMDHVTVLSGNLGRRGYGKKAVVRIKGIDNCDLEVYGVGCGLKGCVCDAYIKPVARKGVK